MPHRGGMQVGEACLQQRSLIRKTMREDSVFLTCSTVRQGSGETTYDR